MTKVVDFDATIQNFFDEAIDFMKRNKPYDTADAVATAENIKTVESIKRDPAGLSGYANRCEKKIRIKNNGFVKLPNGSHDVKNAFKAVLTAIDKYYAAAGEAYGITDTEKKELLKALRRWKFKTANGMLKEMAMNFLDNFVPLEHYAVKTEVQSTR
ncbi:MAG: hypothetical protein FWC51_02180 [Proteobacteria bacterium]|nr:hypothetical protein [Pseudomonadota bacterium]